MGPGQLDPADAPVTAATLDRHDAVAVITLNRPQALNAVDGDLATALGAALSELHSDPALRVGVITGAGRAFSAGADLKAVAAGRSLTATDHPEWGFGGFVHHPVDKPLVAAVNGLALGGGAELVLACDLAVMAEDAVLGLPEVRRGLIAAAGGLIGGARQLPLKVAMELALVGEHLPAQDALRRGLVNRVVPAADVLPTALDLAAAVGRNAPIAVRASRRIIRAAAGAEATAEPGLWQLQAEENERVMRSSDAHEGASAFSEKRPARWRDA